jgi:hypothetical protein
MDIYHPNRTMLAKATARTPATQTMRSSLAVRDEHVKVHQGFGIECYSLQTVQTALTDDGRWPWQG